MRGEVERIRQQRIREERRVEYVLVRVMGVFFIVGLVGVGLWLESFTVIFIHERLLPAE